MTETKTESQTFFANNIPYNNNNIGPLPFNHERVCKFSQLGRTTERGSTAFSKTFASVVPSYPPSASVSPAVTSSPDLDCDYFNSSSMSSVTSAESESSPRPDKRPASPAQSPQPKRARPTELSLDNSPWEADHPPTNSGEQSSIVSDSPRIQLPSIFSTFEDPFRSEHRRASLPTLSSELNSRSRLPSVTPAARGLAPVTHTHIHTHTHTPSSLSSYQFPSQSSLDSDERSSVRPKLAADTQLGLSFPDQASLPSAATLSSSGTATSSSTSPSFTTSNFGSPLTADYSVPRTHLPSLQFSDSESWGTATGQAASLPGIVRPNSTPGPVHSASAPLKYDDNLRHSSLSSSYTFPPANQSTMYGNVARISGQAERRASYTQSSTSDNTKEEWSFSSPDILLPSASANGPVPSPSRTPPAPSAPSSLVDRPQKKRGKLPKPTTDFLKDWLHRHSDHPYPSEDEKKQLCAATGLSMSQVSNWMINARRRILAPVHRPSSGPATTHPLPSQRSGTTHSGVSTSTLLRRASMPTDSLQLYHPLSLQSISQSGSGPIGSDPYYTPSSQQRNVLENGYGGGGRSSSMMGHYTQHSGGASAGYTFPTPGSIPSHHQSGYALGNQHTPSYLSSHGSLPGGGGHGPMYYSHISLSEVKWTQRAIGGDEMLVGGASSYLLPPHVLSLSFPTLRNALLLLHYHHVSLDIYST
ncbi:hypothetical protein B0F90DRAFT_1667001 [Multifurca ochricompacta]|uniref:Homeobox domain-containing protein n=1 Tax=Multifurca ochricompacta TaxID=376703 RepID=A0AAD4M771_9AGAM|nr:hypothetical protein B0F90DRAFT_1667001 [Multifurca ochricompacta]